LAENAEQLGHLFRERMAALVSKRPDLLRLVRGKGLLNAIVVNDTESGQTAWELCLRLAQNGLLAKPTHGNIIRFAPPLVITSQQLDICCSIIEETVLSFEK
jgi:ornithine--oxo-acid transaminase